MTDPYLPGHGDDGYRVRHYDLELRYSVASNHLDGSARVHVVVLEDSDRFSLDLARLRVSKVSVGRRAVRWQHSDGKVTLTLADLVEAGTELVFDVRYSGNPRPVPSLWGPLGWDELTDGVLVASQPSGARSWFPCNDLAAQKATFDVSIETASAYRALLNGSLESTRTRGSTTTWRYIQAEPTSPYLLSAHIGRYDEHVLADGEVAIRLIVGAAERRAAIAAFSSVPRMMATFVERFGPYPFDAGYTVVVCGDELDVPVEAQGQATFGPNHLDPKSQRLVAHELAHQWFGNSVTASTWQDVWLHEGFCCYAEWLWSEADGGPDANRMARDHYEIVRRMPQNLLVGNPGPRDMFDDRVYKRGALALHAVRMTLGDAAFFDLLRRWTATHRHGVATTADFAAMAGAEAERVLQPWLYEAALPSLSSR